MEDRSEKLKAVIRDEIEAAGGIPFARYMELCLYHPELGYYMQEAPPTGRAGDFYTAPHVHRLFGATIARWMQATVDRLELEQPHLLEVGAGNGQLAEDIMDEWERTGRPLPTVQLVEDGPHRRRQLQERFFNRDVSIPEPGDAWPAAPFTGIVVANELLDAMPMRIVGRSPEGLFEVYVTGAGDGFVEEARPLAADDPDLEAVLDFLPEGFRTEFSEGWRQWINAVAGKLSRGAVLLLDYGEPSEAMTMPWRAGGSLRCFRGHQVDDDPYSTPGGKDITANVNFGLVERYARRAGFEVETLRTQSSFLVRNGILDLLAKMVANDEPGGISADWLQVKNLIHDEDGMGAVFKVMVLLKD